MVFISSLWIEKTAKAFSLSSPIRFCENVLMRFRVVKLLSESAKDIVVVKIMLQSFDTGNVFVREIFRRIGKRLEAVPAEENLGFEYMHRSSNSSGFIGIIGKNQM